MKKMKMIISVLSVFMLFFMVACSSSTSTNNGGASQSNPPASGNTGANNPAPAPANNPVSANLSIGTGGTSGTYYFIGAGMSRMFQEHYPSIKLNAEVTAAGLENSRLLFKKDIDLGIIDGATLTVFSKDEPAALENWQQIAGGHSQFMHLIVPKNSDMKSLKDIKGKRVAVGAAGSGNEVVVRQLLKMYGFTYDDIKPFYLNYAESVDAFKTGQLDLFMIITGVPAVAVTDLETSTEFKFLEVEDEILAKVGPDYPGIIKITLPNGVYKHQEKELKSVGINAQLIVNNDFSDDLAYQFAKTIHEHWKTIQESHPAGAEWSQTPELLFQGNILPFHPGAVKYYKEAGLWDKKPEHLKEGN